MRFFVAQAQGRRPYMEDTYCFKHIAKNVSLFGVFDGHNGDKIAQLCKNSAPDVFKQCCLLHGNDIPISIRQTFAVLDDLAKATGHDDVGCTAAICVLTPSRLYFANAGDSMSMLCVNKNEMIMMSKEHKVENEKERILSEGGMVTYWDGVARVNGTLNVARSIGDHYMKQHVIAEPYITSFSLSQKGQQVKYILMASDGLWDVYNMSDIHTRLDMLITKNDGNMTRALEELVQLAIKEGSTDNITVLVIELQ
jgi:serine/threonine protein phosphatase PrpC